MISGDCTAVEAAAEPPAVGLLRGDRGGRALGRGIDPGAMLACVA
ncbi:MAG: hypothetical protein ACYTF8_16690 [Planctomycetota bacterium]